MIHPIPRPYRPFDLLLISRMSEAVAGKTLGAPKVMLNDAIDFCAPAVEQLDYVLRQGRVPRDPVIASQRLSLFESVFRETHVISAPPTEIGNSLDLCLNSFVNIQHQGVLTSNQVVMLLRMTPVFRLINLQTVAKRYEEAVRERHLDELGE